jgi:hypothetical protein
MSDTVGHKTVDVEIDGEKLSFPKLTPYDRADILRELKRARRLELIETLKLTGADKTEMFGELSRFDSEGYGEHHFRDYVVTLEGRADVFRRSWKKLGRDDAPNVPQDGELELVGFLCGIPPTILRKIADTLDADDGDGAEGTSPNVQTPPTEPDTYGSPTA